MPPEGGRRGTRQRRGGRPRGAGRTQAVGVTCIGSTGAWCTPAVGILSALGSRLSALGSRLSALGSRLSALGSRLSALGSRLSALGSRLSALGSRLSALGSRLSALGSRLSALGSRLSALGSRLSALGSRLSALGSRLSALGSRLSALGSRLSALGSRLSALGSLNSVEPSAPDSSPGAGLNGSHRPALNPPTVSCVNVPEAVSPRPSAAASPRRLPGSVPELSAPEIVRIDAICRLPPCPSPVPLAGGRSSRGTAPLPGIFGTYHAVERRRNVPASFGTLVIRWRSLPIVEWPVNPPNPAPRGISRWPDCRYGLSQRNPTSRATRTSWAGNVGLRCANPTCGPPEHRCPSSHRSVKWPCPAPDTATDVGEHQESCGSQGIFS